MHLICITSWHFCPIFPLLFSCFPVHCASPTVLLSILFVYSCSHSCYTKLEPILILLLLIVIVLIFTISDPIGLGFFPHKSPISPFLCLQNAWITLFLQIVITHLHLCFPFCLLTEAKMNRGELPQRKSIMVHQHAATYSGIMWRTNAKSFFEVALLGMESLQIRHHKDCPSSNIIGD